MDCQQAKEFFRRNGIPYKDNNVAADPGARKRLEKLVGRVATPTIVVDHEVLIGFEDNRERLESLLKRERGAA